MTRIWILSFRWALLTAFAMAAASAVRPAKADVVHVLSGNGYGEGWMFLDQDGHCKVVTARHVVMNPQGTKFRRVTIQGDHGLTAQAAPPFLNSQALDIAILPLPAFDNPSTCGPGRLSAIAAESRMTGMTDANIVTAEDDARTNLPVAYRSSPMVNGSYRFNVRPRLQKDHIGKGISGSVVLDEDGPIGIVLQVDELLDEAIVVRVDGIRALLDQPPPPTPPHDLGKPFLSGIAAASPDPERGPQQCLSGSGSTWHAVPNGNTVTITATYPVPVQIHEVILAQTTGQNTIQAVSVSTQASDDTQEWTDGNYCTAAASAQLTCPLLIRTVTRVRLILKTRSHAPIDIGGLLVR